MDVKTRIAELLKQSSDQWDEFKQQTNLTVGSLFAGIGGIDAGLESTGCFKTVWQVEHDDYASKILKKHWPDVRRCKLVQKFPPAHDTWNCDLICGGFPCQPISVAGHQKGMDDTRWLWPHFHRIINAVKPKYVLIENVRNLLSISDGKVFEIVLNDLAKSGYDAEWQTISAANLGAPHRRPRVFIFAYPTSISRTEGRGGIATRIGDVAKSRSSGIWTTEPKVDRVADGIPNRPHRLKCLGNAVCPPVAEFVGNWMLRTMYEMNL